MLTESLRGTEQATFQGAPAIDFAQASPALRREGPQAATIEEILLLQGRPPEGGRPRRRLGPRGHRPGQQLVNHVSPQLQAVEERHSAGGDGPRRAEWATASRPGSPPESTSGTIQWTVTPVSRSPPASCRNSVTPPRYSGSSDECTVDRQSAPS